ncbi:MAG: exodeoxyribonuclease VII small subunit [Clostridia bacterium]|jgi:exodeoxyribonuclease VII small subunit|nr:exodeoxyribonuclease VII small subunit [Clostridia bacterium]
MAINHSEAPELNFEEAMARLEQIVRALEGGNVPLDESLTLYEEGVKLVKLCSSRLENAEKRIKILVDGGNGTLIEQDFAEGGSRG